MKHVVCAPYSRKLGTSEERESLSIIFNPDSLVVKGPGAQKNRWEAVLSNRKIDNYLESLFELID